MSNRVPTSPALGERDRPAVGVDGRRSLRRGDVAPTVRHHRREVGRLRLAHAFALVDERSAFVMHIDDSTGIGADPRLLVGAVDDRAPPRPPDGRRFEQLVLRKDAPNSFERVVDEPALKPVGFTHLDGDSRDPHPRRFGSKDAVGSLTVDDHVRTVGFRQPRDLFVRHIGPDV